jgi:hypothetical protein
MISKAPRLATAALLSVLCVFQATIGPVTASAAIPVSASRARLVVGEWEDKTEPIQKFRLSLRPDGSYRLTVQDLGGPKSDHGQWRLDGDTLVLVMTDTERRDESGRPEKRYQVGTLSEKSLNVRATSGRSEFRFTRALPVK